MKSENDVEVVISGIGGYFPKTKNVEELSQKLFDHEEFIDAARWKAGQLEVCDMTGNIELLNLFDASYFGVHRQQSLFMDPMSRMALQNTFEAIIDAGVNPVEIRGKKIGVFMASSLSENDSLMFENVENGFGVTGQARTMLANRISYWLNAVGPSYSCDSSWLGGIQVLEQGFQAIKTGICDAVVIGATNLTINIYPHYLYSQLGLVSPDGKTRPFEDTANGYARSDTNCILFLQRADLARRCYATVLNAEVHFNGTHYGKLSRLDIDNCRRFLTDFYKNANVDPSTVQYVETNGTAIKHVDALEITVLDDVLNKGRKGPLLIGSVKSNVGNAEAASMLLSIVKTIIAMENNLIPANLNYNENNVTLKPIKEGRMKVVSENTTWEGDLAAVNGIGLVSSFGHVLLKGNSVKRNEEQTSDKELQHLFLLSTRTEDGIIQLLDKIKSQPDLNLEYTKMINTVFSTHIPGHLYRGYVVKGLEDTPQEEFSHYSGINRPIWFIYSGMGSQWPAMGKSLMNLPICAEIFQRCHKVLEPFNVDLMNILTNENDPEIFKNILHCFVGIAAVQIALTDVLLSLGIKPDKMVGHSVGELGCAYADGCLTAEQMILSSYYRGRASVEAELIPGMMAAIGLGAEQMKPLCPEDIDVACHNGPDSSTISGPKESLCNFVADLQAKGTFARLVNVAGIAYHSRYIKPAAPGLLKYLKELIPEPKTRSEKWVCSSVPEAGGGWNSDLVKTASAEYLTNNLLSSVYFEEACRHIPKEAVAIEIAPHGLLQAILRRSLDSSCINVALTKRGATNSVTFLMQAIGKLYLAGLSMDASPLYEPLGHHNEGKKKHQFVPRGTPCLANLVTWAHTETWRTGLDEFKDYSNSEQTYHLDRTSEIFKDLQGYKILGIMDDAVSSIIIPIATYLPLVCKILSNTKRVDNAVFENIQLVRHRVLPAASEVYIPPIRIMVQRGTGQFEVSDRYGVVAKGIITVPENNKDIITLNSFYETMNIGKKVTHLDGEEFYKELSSRGHVLQLNLKSVKEVDIFQNGMKAQIQWKSGWYSFVLSMLQLCIYRSGEFEKQALDTSFIRTLAVTFLEQFIPQNDAIIPVIYNYSTGTISSPLLNIQGPVCAPVKFNNNPIIIDNFYTNYDFSTIKLSPTETVNIGAISINEHNLNINDLQTKSAEWLDELNKLLDSDKCEYVYLISRVLPPNGINYFLHYLRRLKNGNCIKLVFVLDSKAPDFKAIEDEFYEFVFTDIDNTVFIYKSGKWDKMYNASVELTQVIENQEEENILTESYIKRHIPKIDVRYMGINSSSLVSTEINQNQEKKMGILDYSGIEISTKKRIMGLASQRKANHLTTDPILRWELPEDWSLVDGATSMYAYAMAYHALFEILTIQPGESILIHNGCSNLGQALIRVANTQGCVIYTTVANEKQKAILLDHMKMLHEYQILDYNNVRFERKLMAITQGQGVRVVINCLTGELLRASSRCVCTLGRFLIFQDEETDVDYTETIGLGLFFKCKGMYGLSLSGICNFSVEMKNKIHEHIENGLKMKHIVPLRRSIFKGSEKKLGHILRYITGPYVTGSAIISVKDNTDLKSSKNEQNLNKKINNKPKDGTIIVYGGNEAEKISTTLRWLSIKYSTTKVILISPLCAQKNTVEHNYLNRFIANLRKYKPEFTLELLEAPANDATARNVAQKLLTLTPKIQTVINLTSENNPTLLSLNKKLPSLRFVFLSPSGSSNRYNDIYAPYKNASFISWDKKRSFSQVINCLQHAIENEVEIIVRKANLEEDEDNQNSLSYRDFFSLLPSSIPSISTWNPPTATVQINSLNTSGSCEKNESPPVFVVPGLFGEQCRYLRSMLRRLLTPAYVLDSSYENISYDELAEKMAKRICEICPDGPYNLIGVSTGGALALEIAKYLEITAQANVQIYLLDGIPETVQHILNEAKTARTSKQAEIDNFYKLMSVDVDLKHPRAKKAAEGFLKRINAILSYKPNVKPLSSVVRIVRPLDSTKDCSGDLQEFCKQTRIAIIKGNHFTMLQTNNIADYINENILISGHNL